ncbi:hypothetical protein C8F04DRAFT_1203192 [Mycena alexandri]|uniref:Uncharacterized protein n=1 Tax=Mycena alexandri TaxID=1745969 RepID=A0AAD6RX60_9AGAR|nr:hypothetical protein C8F04DRAFT_1203192 [Mycena alexandri]
MLPALCFFLSGYPPPPARPSAAHFPWYPSVQRCYPHFFCPFRVAIPPISALRHWYNTPLPALWLVHRRLVRTSALLPRPSDPPPHIYHGTPPVQRCHLLFSARSALLLRRSAFYVIGTTLFFPPSGWYTAISCALQRCYPALPTLRPTSTVVPLPFNAATPPFFGPFRVASPPISVLRNWYNTSLPALCVGTPPSRPGNRTLRRPFALPLTPPLPLRRISSARPAITTFLASSFPHDDILAPSTSAPVSAARVPPTALLSRFAPSRASDDIKPAAAPPPSSRLVATCVPGTLCPLLASRFSAASASVTDVPLRFPPRLSQP